MAVSVNDLVPRVRDLLSDAPYTTTSTTTTTSTSVNVGDNTVWSPGDIGEWQTGTVGYEQFLVTDSSANPLVVVRGYNGTTAETHTSGDRIFQNPIHPGRNIQQALNRAVRSLWPFVYKAADLTVTPVVNTRWYNLDSTTAGIIRVSQEDSAGLLCRYGGRGQFAYGTDFVLPTTTVTSGRGITFPRMYSPSNDIIVTVMKVVTGTSDIEDSGQFPVGDYCITFAAGQLVAAMELPRVSEGTDLETSGTVGTGDRLNTGRTFQLEAKQKLETLTYIYRDFYRPLGR